MMKYLYLSKGYLILLGGGFKYFLEKTNNYCPFGSDILCSLLSMVFLYMLLYKNINLKVLCSISTQGGGSTFPSKTFEYSWNYWNVNIHSYLFPFPKHFSYLFDFSNKMVSKNQVQKSELALYQMWVTHNPHL